jgi:hypothetical protein
VNRANKSTEEFTGCWSYRSSNERQYTPMNGTIEPLIGQKSQQITTRRRGFLLRNANIQGSISRAIYKIWPLLEQAIEHKIEQQAEFVRWWRENVTPNKGSRTDINAERRFSCADAEADSGITQQQVSRLAGNGRVQYREVLYQATPIVRRWRNGGRGATLKANQSKAAQGRN